MIVKESEKLNKYLDFARELKRKIMEHESDIDTNHSRSPLNHPEDHRKEMGGIKN